MTDKTVKFDDSGRISNTDGERTHLLSDDVDWKDVAHLRSLQAEPETQLGFASAHAFGSPFMPQPVRDREMRFIDDQSVDHPYPVVELLGQAELYLGFTAQEGSAHEKHAGKGHHFARGHLQATLEFDENIFPSESDAQPELRRDRHPPKTENNADSDVKQQLETAFESSFFHNPFTDSQLDHVGKSIARAVLTHDNGRLQKELNELKSRQLSDVDIRKDLEAQVKRYNADVGYRGGKLVQLRVDSASIHVMVKCGSVMLEGSLSYDPATDEQFKPDIKDAKVQAQFAEDLNLPKGDLAKMSAADMAIMSAMKNGDGPALRSVLGMLTNDQKEISFQDIAKYDHQILGGVPVNFAVAWDRDGRLVSVGYPPLVLFGTNVIVPPPPDAHQ